MYEVFFLINLKHYKISRIRSRPTTFTIYIFFNLKSTNYGYQVFVVGGSWSGGRFNKKAEVWTAGTGWVTFENVDSDQTIRQGAPDPVGVYRDGNHA